MENALQNHQFGTKINLGPVFIAVAAFFWTLDFWSRNYILNYIVQPSVIVLWEHVIITIAIIPLIIMSFRILFSFNLKEWIAVLFIGVGASALATILLTLGYQLGFQYGANVALSQQIQPVVAIGMAHIMLKERLPKYYYPLSLMAIGGIFLMYWPYINSFNNLNLSQVGLLAAFYGLTAAILWGSGTVFGKYLMDYSEHKINYKEMTTFRFFVAFIFLLIFNLITEKSNILSPGLSNKYVLLNLLYIALIVGLFSLVLYYYGLKTTDASVSTIFELAFPLSFLLIVPFINQFFGGDFHFSIYQIIGASILIIATTILSYIYGTQTNPIILEESQDEMANQKEKMYPENN